MTIESNIFDALKGLVGNRCFPDMAPLSTVKPYITYSQIGGEAVTYLGAEVPSKKNGRFQINVWADTRASASNLILQVESAMTLATTFQAKPVSAPNTDYDNDMFTYGSMQDFTVWSDR
jgi:hypothetical protein